MSDAPMPQGPTRIAQELAEKGRALSQKVATEIGRVVVGMEDVARKLLIALIGNGHVLLEGVPGVAKTTLSKTFAHILGCQYQRVQFTPDLLPSDVTGTSILDRRTNDFVLRKGARFHNGDAVTADDVKFSFERYRGAAARTLKDVVAAGKAAVVLDAPLLLEAGWKPLCDFVLFVDVPHETRLARARSRGWSDAKFARREAAQWPAAEKRRT